MFQKFNEDTLGGRYIKSLLAQTPIPLFNAVVDGDQLVAGCYYVYKRFIIECVVSGVLFVDKSETILYPSKELYPSVVLFPKIGKRAARFYVRSVVDSPHVKTHATYNSITNYYDSDTHYHLGRYLRYLLTTTNLNLLPFYNCYNSTQLSDVELYVGKLPNKPEQVLSKKVFKQKSKVVAIPILYGHTYSIFINCPTQVMMKAIIHDNSGYVDETTLSDNIVRNIQNSGRQYANMSFKDPIKFRVETDNMEAMMFERNLYLVIQLPLSNTSSIVVLENYDKVLGVQCDKDGVKQYSVINPSLLAMDTKESYAFSDRLIEYLLGHVIHANDPVTQNIATVQTLFSNKSFDYKRRFISRDFTTGVWDKDLSNQIQNYVQSNLTNAMIYDQDGYFNKDLQRMIYLGGRNNYL